MDGLRARPHRHLGHGHVPAGLGELPVPRSGGVRQRQRPLPGVQGCFAPGKSFLGLVISDGLCCYMVLVVVNVYGSVECTLIFWFESVVMAGGKTNSKIYMNECHQLFKNKPMLSVGKLVINFDFLLKSITISDL